MNADMLLATALAAWDGTAGARTMPRGAACSEITASTFESGLGEELESLLVRETGNANFFLGLDVDLDEPSDAEDPEQQLRAAVDGLRAEVADQRTMLAAREALVQAVQGALECRGVLLDL